MTRPTPAISELHPHLPPQLVEPKLPAPTPPVTLRIKRLSPRATLPEYKSAGAAGLDLAACLPEGDSITIYPGRVMRIPTGLAIAIPHGHEGQVRARSGLSSTNLIAPINSPGTIDSDYRGELLIPLINHSEVPFEVTHNLRIAQLIIAPVAHAAITEVTDLDATTRGTNGFGSTG